MRPRPVADLVVNAGNMAIWNRQPVEGVIHHSDQGAQYTSLAFGQTLRQAGIVGSVGSVWDAIDNALAFATLQTALLNKRSWPTRATLMTAILEYIEEFYDRRRRHTSLSQLSPDEYKGRGLEDLPEEGKAVYLSTVHETGVTPCLNKTVLAFDATSDFRG